MLPLKELEAFRRHCRCLAATGAARASPQARVEHDIGDADGLRLVAAAKLGWFGDEGTGGDPADVERGGEQSFDGPGAGKPL